MNKKCPSVSIVIPCYNDEEYVGEAIRSALGQDYNSVEVIVIDDGSSDGSLNVIRSYDEYITWRTGENRGACHARNRGLDLANSTFVKFLDADDELHEEAVQSQIQQSVQAPQQNTIFFGDARFVNPSARWDKKSRYRKKRKGESRVGYIMDVNPQTSMPLHRRLHLQKIGGFDESLPRSQEYDLHIRLAVAGVTFCYRPAPVAKIRWHSGGSRITNQNFFERNPRGRLQRIRKWRELIEEENMLDDQVRQILARRAWAGGRIALRQGYLDVAKEYFSCARNLHREPVAGASGAYRSVVRLAGPRVAEHVASWARELGLNRLVGDSD